MCLENCSNLILCYTVERYLPNTDFSHLVAEGLIGTRGVQTEAVKAIIRRRYEAGIAIYVGRETGPRRKKGRLV